MAIQSLLMNQHYMNKLQYKESKDIYPVNQIYHMKIVKWLVQFKIKLNLRPIFVIIEGYYFGKHEL